MSVDLLSPAKLAQDTPYHHVAVASGGTLVTVAGQVGWRPGGELAEGLAAQTAQTLRNVAVGLSAAGATFADVVRLTFYVVDWTQDKMSQFMAGVAEVAEEIGLPATLPPSSLIGVQVLFAEGIAIEVEATAVISGPGHAPA
jgi:enamine deaminase RidA (YjgF/YER057c/UK114 family)